MTTGLPRAPIYPEIPKHPADYEVESLDTFHNIDEHRQLIEKLFLIDTKKQLRLSEADLEARRTQMAGAKEIGHRRSRSTSELSVLLGATVTQMEEELRGKSLLEIGAGYGRFGEAMARNAKSEVTFLDRDQEALNHISRRAGKIVLGEGTNLPFEDETFDRTMNGFSSVHWAEEPVESVRALNEALRVTKVGGAVIIIPLLNSISQRRELLPVIFRDSLATGQIQDIDRYALVRALQDVVLIKNLFSLAEKNLVSVTWSNHLAETHVPGVRQEMYSVIIDKGQSISRGDFEIGEEYARQFMPAS